MNSPLQVCGISFLLLVITFVLATSGNEKQVNALKFVPLNEQKHQQSSSSSSVCGTMSTEQQCSAHAGCSWCTSFNQTKKSSCSFCIDASEETCCTAPRAACAKACTKNQKCHRGRNSQNQEFAGCCDIGAAPCTGTYGITCCAEGSSCCGWGSDCPSCCQKGSSCCGADHLTQCAPPGYQCCSDNMNAWFCPGAVGWQCGISYGGIDCRGPCSRRVGYVPDGEARWNASAPTANDCCDSCASSGMYPLSAMYDFKKKHCFCYNTTKLKETTNQDLAALIPN